MRHGRKVNHLGRTSKHRHALLSNMASSLILEKRIMTTLAKAKALRQYVEPLLTRAKDDTTHSRRTVFSYLQNKESIKVLFDEVAQRIATRNGGYTRIIKLAPRAGDNAEICYIELVDYNAFTAAASESKDSGKTRRGRRKKSGADLEKSETPVVENTTTTTDTPAAE
jgi:large subunit ribosomal protein L17